MSSPLRKLTNQLRAVLDEDAVRDAAAALAAVLSPEEKRALLKKRGEPESIAATLLRAARTAKLDRTYKGYQIQRAVAELMSYLNSYVKEDAGLGRLSPSDQRSLERDGVIWRRTRSGRTIGIEPDRGVVLGHPKVVAAAQGAAANDDGVAPAEQEKAAKLRDANWDKDEAEKLAKDLAPSWPEIGGKFMGLLKKMGATKQFADSFEELVTAAKVAAGEKDEAIDAGWHTAAESLREVAELLSSTTSANAGSFVGPAFAQKKASMPRKRKRRSL